MDDNHGTKATREGEEDTARKRFRSESRPTDVGLAVKTTDEEVEEFYAIVRRMHVVARMMSRAAIPSAEASVVGDVPKKMGILDWRPTFKMEDFGEVEEGDSGVQVLKLGHSKEEGTARAKKKGIGLVGGAGVGLDLNAEPEPEGVPG